MILLQIIPLLLIYENEVDTMNIETKNELFFEKFFHEFRMGLRSEDQPFVDKLVQDLVEISKIIPPAKNGQYSFRETLMLIALINQRAIQKFRNTSQR